MKAEFDYVGFARAMHLARWEAKISLRELSAMCNISLSTLHRIENGYVKPKIASILIISSELGISYMDYVKIAPVGKI